MNQEQRRELLRALDICRAQRRELDGHWSRAVLRDVVDTAAEAFAQVEDTLLSVVLREGAVTQEVYKRS